MRIEIYYNGIKNANDALERFKNEGFTNSAVDLNDNYIDFDNYEYSFSNAISSKGVFSDNEQKSFQASDGMGNFSDVLTSSYKVVVNTDPLYSEDKIKNLKKIIEETGGNLKTTI
ncbi:hypothetical protein [Clostridium sp.]|jgi:hypothetical protein|uniref:hypothetical protein n=1 Tax=Clostridium sp. TaxID=1506 RepID=UPI003A5C0E0B